jgi:phage tail-like protein
MTVSESTPSLIENRISVAADYYRRYPGDSVKLFTRVEASPDWEHARLQITLPPGLVYTVSYMSGPPKNKVPQIATTQGKTFVVWDLVPEEDGTLSYECEVEATLAPINYDSSFPCQFLLTVNQADGEPSSEEDTVTIRGLAKGTYLKYLPAIYQEDELMGRFLMLFESFLAPIEGQIENQNFYLDPLMAPPELLPWLASWSGVTLDDQLPDDRRRTLLKEMPVLYKKRGTHWGLKRHLEIFTGGKVQIIEHYSRNFALGDRAFLGPGVALGTKNVPNTFSVSIQLPARSAQPAEDELERDRVFEQKIIAIIEAAKPVHTGYNLQITR